MSGGKTNQSSNYNSSISFSPVITDHGSITNGNISTGSTTGSLNGSSTGAGGTLGLSLSPKLMNLYMMRDNDPMATHYTNVPGVQPAAPNMVKVADPFATIYKPAVPTHIPTGPMMVRDLSEPWATVYRPVKLI